MTPMKFIRVTFTFHDHTARRAYYQITTPDVPESQVYSRMFAETEKYYQRIGYQLKSVQIEQVCLREE